MKSSAVVGALTIAVAACSIMTGLDGYSGGSATDVPDASSEAGPAPDASVSDASASDASRFCESLRATNPKVVFCDDFDEPGRTVVTAASPLAWQNELLQGGQNHGSLVDGPLAFSPPRAAKIELTLVPSGTPSRGRMLQSVSLPSTRVALHLKFKRTGASTGSAFAVEAGCRFSFEPDSGRVEVSCADGFRGDGRLTTASPGPETWHSMTLGFTRGPDDAGAPVTATEFLELGEGPTALRFEKDFVGGLSPNVTVVLGQRSNDHTGTFYYDDVYVESE